MDLALYQSLTRAGVSEHQAKTTAVAIRAEVVRQVDERTAGLVSETTFQAETAKLRQELKDGLGDVRKELADGLAEVRKEMADGLAEVRKEMADGLAAVRKEMADGLAAVRKEMADGFAEIRKEMKEGQAELRQEFKRDLAELRREFKAETAELRRDIADIRKEITLLRSEMDARILSLHRWTIGIGFGMCGLFLGVTRLWPAP